MKNRPKLAATFLIVDALRAAKLFGRFGSTANLARSIAQAVHAYNLFWRAILTGEALT